MRWRKNVERTMVASSKNGQVIAEVERAGTVKMADASYALKFTGPPALSSGAPVFLCHKGRAAFMLHRLPA
jgi:hypothetical protein